jgi:adenosylcobyric acid synthase
VNADGRIWGCYLHGIFENDAFRRRWLAELGWQGAAHSATTLRQQEYDRLADVVEAALDWAHIERLIGL